MRSRHFEFLRPALLCSLCTSLLIVTTASAQSTPDWNRAIGPFGATPSAGGPAGSHDLSIGWEYEAVSAGVLPGTFDTEVVYRVNGIDTAVILETALDPGSTSGGANPGACSGGTCGGSCGSATIGGSPAALLCTPDLSGTCGCRAPITTIVPMEPLTPGDEIMVLLRPAPGALPETDPSDDLGMVTLGNWNRRIISATSSPGAPGHVDLLVTWAVDLVDASTLPIELGARFEVEVGGTPLPSHTTDNPACILWDIQDSCVTVSGQELTLTCDQGTCSSPPMITPVPNVPEPPPPSGTIKVILKPAPGALPELPGFPGDDEAEVVPEVNVPGAIGVLSALALGLVGMAALIRRDRRSV